MNLSLGKMDRCGAAHRQREAVNAVARERLEDWVLSIAPACAGDAVLDLGCGTGKLTLPYARAVGEAGRVLGVDIAADSLAELQSRAKREGLTNITTCEGNLDDFLQSTAGEDCDCNELHALPSALSGLHAQFAKKFDLIVSSYAIYYASDAAMLIRSLAGLLCEGGRVFVCGPGVGTNREMDELVGQAAPDAKTPPLTDFMSLEQMAVASTTYTKFDTHRLDNEVTFHESDALLAWWRNHNMYSPAADEAVSQAVREHFAAHGEFTLTKNVLGILFCR